MRSNINICIVGLGQIGIYLYNELNLKKKDIEKRTGKKIKIVAISARNKNKKRRFPISKKIFYKDPLSILKRLFLFLFFAEIATILIFLPVFFSISFFFRLNSL